MIPYLITFGITIILTCFAEILIKNKQKILAFVIIGLSIFTLSFLAGVRNDEVGKDIEVYVTPVFEWAQEMEFKDFIKRGDVENGYKIFVYAMTQIFNNHYYILFVMQAVISTAVYIFAYKNREKVSMTLMVLTYLMIFYNDTLTIMRQSIAMGFLLVSIITFKDKKYIKTSILYLLAIAFQNTAIVGILIYIIITIDNTTKINKRSKFFINAMIIIGFYTCAFLYQEILYMFTYDIPILPDRFYAYLSSSYYNEGGLNISKANLIFKGIWIFIAFYMSQLVKEQGIKTYSKFLFIDLGIYFISFKLAPVIRLGYYFTLPALLSIIPRTNEIFKNEKYNKIGVNVLVIGFLFVYWYFTFVMHGDAGGTYPYTSDILNHIF